VIGDEQGAEGGGEGARQRWPSFLCVAGWGLGGSSIGYGQVPGVGEARQEGSGPN
jgi:hypothetical protein